MNGRSQTDNFFEVYNNNFLNHNLQKTYLRHIITISSFIVSKNAHSYIKVTLYRQHPEKLV
jgi:hypothetical protein